jgi:iron complex transport system substrate-binding protein
MIDYYPQRIVCLAAEVPEILDRLGALDRVVAVSSFARRPGAVRRLPKVGGFSNADAEKVLSHRPDLVITISDIQADIAATLIRHGVPVLALNPHRLVDSWQSILLIGGVLGLQAEAQRVATHLQDELESLRCADPLRPRVYFEEWHDPLISGIGWVEDLIDLVGGESVFPELRDKGLATQRIIQSGDVVSARPDVIVASWCGKPADLDAIRNRAGWETIPAVQQDRVYEIPSDQILQIGPSIVEGARALKRMVDAARNEGRTHD